MSISNFLRKMFDSSILNIGRNETNIKQIFPVALDPTKGFKNDLNKYIWATAREKVPSDKIFDIKEKGLISKINVSKV